MKIMNSIILLSILLLGVGEKVLIGTVSGVKDGDTIVLVSDNVSYNVRLDAIDAPEKKQEFGEVSKKALTDMILGQEVILTYTYD